MTKKISNKILLITVLLFFSLFAKAQSNVDEKLALQFYQNKDFDKAAELYKKIYSKKPTPIFYNYYLNCLFELKDYNEAKSFVHTVAKKHPDNIKYQVEEAYVLQKSGKTDKAKKSYEKIIKKSDKTRTVVTNLSDAFMVRGLNNYALKTMLRAKSSIKEPPLNMEIADLYYKMGDYNSMISEYLEFALVDDKYIGEVKAKLQIIITDPSQDEISEALKTELLKGTQKHPNETLYSELLYWYSIQKKEFEIALIQAKALDIQFNSPGERVFDLGNILMSNKEYLLATEAFQYVVDLGDDNRFSSTASIKLLNAKFKKIVAVGNYQQSELVELEKAYFLKLEQYGQNATTVPMMMNLAYLQAFYLDKIEDAKILLSPIQTMRNVQPVLKAKAKIQLADMMLFSGEKWGASQIYKQVEKAHKNEPIGYEAKFKAAKFYYYVGEMEWAKVQLKVLSGATSKLIANDAIALYLLITENISPDSTYDALSIYSKADLLAYQHKYSDAISTIDTLINIFPHYEIIDDAWYKKAKIAMEMKKYVLADSLFDRTFEYNPYGTVADNALIERARLNDNILNNKPKAKELYKKIIMDYYGSLFIVEARKRYREMEAE
jgi:tetratricopeptide (TPR) repeat protein